MLQFSSSPIRIWVEMSCTSGSVVGSVPLGMESLERSLRFGPFSCCARLTLHLNIRFISLKSKQVQQPDFSAASHVVFEIQMTSGQDPPTDFSHLSSRLKTKPLLKVLFTRLVMQLKHAKAGDVEWFLPDSGPGSNQEENLSSFVILPERGRITWST